MDAYAKLEQIAALVEGARAMPMSASCLVHREELLGHLDELTALLPVELGHAREVLDERDAVLAAAHEQAGSIVAAARAQRERLLSADVLHTAARGDAERLLATARADAQRLQALADDYVDGKLANFEVVLHKTLQAVGRGRAKLAGAPPGGDLAAPEDDLAAREPGLPAQPECR